MPTKKVKNAPTTVVEAAVHVETTAKIVEIKSKSSINFEALVLGAMFIAEGNDEQVEASHKEVATTLLSLDSPEIDKAIETLKEENMIDADGKLTSLGRTTAIKRNNWSTRNQYSLNFSDFLKNTNLNYQMAAVSILTLGDSSKNATGIVDKVFDLIKASKFVPQDSFKASVLALTKAWIDLADECGLSNEIDEYLYPSEEVGELAPVAAA